MRFETMLNSIISTYSDNNHALTVLFISSTSVIFKVYMGSGMTNVYKGVLSNDSYSITPVLIDETDLSDV